MNEPDSIIECSSSLGLKNTCLFDQAALSADISKDLTLQLLANCVYLVNATILKERKLLPEDFFSEFCVYGDTYAYLVKQDTPQQRKLLNKLNAPNEGICQQLLHKLAIVIEENINTQPVETFIWTFVYDSSMSASAEIGYKGQKSKFTVKYQDMESTCQQFCKLVSEIRSVLESLRPLPRGMVPSLKVACRGDPVLGDGFHQVDEFVDLNQVTVGSTAFAFNTGFHFAYASQFAADAGRARTPEAVEYESFIRSEDVFNSPVAPIEVSRRNTLGFEDQGNFSNPGSPAELQNGADDVEANISMNCNPSAPSRPVLQSEIADVHMESEDEDDHEEPPPAKIAPRRRSKVVTSPKKGAKEKSRKDKSAEKKRSARSVKKPEVEKEKSETIQKKKKAARRLSDLVSAEKTPSQKEPVPEVPRKESQETELMQVEDAKIVEEPMNVDPIEPEAVEDPVEIQKIQRFGMASITPSKAASPQKPVERSQKYGKVDSLQKMMEEQKISVENPEAIQEDVEVPENPVKTSPRYGRVPSLRKLTQTEKDNVTPVKHVVPEDVVTIPEERPTPVRRYARVPSLRELVREPAVVQKESEALPEVPVKSRRYGQVPSLLRLTESSEGSSRISQSRPRKFGQSFCFATRK